MQRRDLLETRERLACNRCLARVALPAAGEIKTSWPARLVQSVGRLGEHTRQKHHADKGYDYPRCRRSLPERGIATCIARRGIEKSTSRLGRHGWVVERTLAWLSRYRRLCVRYERRADIHEAFLEEGCVLICFNRLLKEF